MDKNTSNTPVKTLTRIHLISSTKECLCIVCGDNIENSNYRVKLFHKDAKTSHCVLIEKYLSVFITKDEFTSHVCQTCFRKFVTVEKKVCALKEKFDATLQKLKSTHERQSQKRLMTNPDSTSKNSPLKPRENNENIRTSMSYMRVNIFFLSFFLSEIVVYYLEQFIKHVS